MSGERCEHPAGKRPLYDARGIFCSYVCDDCEAEKRKEFRPEIFTDPNYEASEDIDGDFSMARDEKVILGYRVTRYRGESYIHDHIAIRDPAGVEMRMGPGGKDYIYEWPIGLSDRELMFVIQGIKVGRWVAAEQMSEALQALAMHDLHRVRHGNQDDTMLAHFKREEELESEIRQEVHRRRFGLKAPRKKKATVSD